MERKRAMGSRRRMKCKFCGDTVLAVLYAMNHTECNGCGVVDSAIQDGDGNPVMFEDEEEIKEPVADVFPNAG